MSRLDLSKLPEPLRQKLQSRLDRLPAEIREKLLANLGKVPPQMLASLLERGEPMLDKLLDRIESELPGVSRPPSIPGSTTHSPVRSPQIAQGGHYSKTVQRGDNLSLRFLVVVMLLIGVVVLLWQSGVLDRPA